MGSPCLQWWSWENAARVLRKDGACPHSVRMRRPPYLGPGRRADYPQGSHRKEPMSAIPIVMAWSGGKDSAVALYRLQQDPRYEVRGLLTTVTEGYDRISMHGVRNTLLDAQAEALGLPVYRV